MVRHCVLVRAKPGLWEGEIEVVLDGLRALGSRLPGMLAFAGGRDVSPEGLQRGYTHAFTIDFADAGARDGYLSDAEHKALGMRLTAVAEGGREGILAIDFET